MFEVSAKHEMLHVLAHVQQRASNDLRPTARAQHLTSDSFLPIAYVQELTSQSLPYTAQDPRERKMQDLSFM